MSQALVGNERRHSSCARARLAAICLGFQFAFVAAPALAYRTGEDSPELAGRGRVAWSSNEVGFLVSATDLPPGVGREQVEQALASSLATWSRPTCSQFRPFFAGWTDAAPSARDQKNTIGWVTNWAGRGYPKWAPGNTEIQYRGHDNRWEIAEADVYLDASEYEWTTADGQDTSVQAVLSHELGHALGLLHPCEPDGADSAPSCDKASPDVAATTMFPFYDATQSSLSEDDVAGLCYLYPVTADPCEGQCGPRQICVDSECRNPCGDQLCSSHESCGAWGCAPEGACLARSCVGQPCDRSEACGPLAKCERNACVTGAAAWGDACSTSPDCKNGACVNNVCQPPCNLDVECAPWGSCEPTADGSARGCISSGAYEQWAHCAAGEDCRSGMCVFIERDARCTTECSSRSDCPRDWSCRSVEQRSVCVPPEFDAKGGCSVSASNSGAPSNFGAWLFALAALLSARRHLQWAVRRAAALL